MEIWPPVQAAVTVNLKDSYSPPFSNLGDLVATVVNNAFYLAGFLLVVLFIIGGYKIISSAGSGDKNNLESGKKALTAAALGFAIIISSYFIIQIIEAITGVTILNPSL